MDKRNIEIKLRLSKDEADALNRRVKKSGISREAYIRHLIKGSVPREAPPPDYFSMMRELYGIGRNLNQIAQKAHILGVIDVQRYDAQARNLEAAVKRITDAVILPGLMENMFRPRSLLCEEKEYLRSNKPSAGHVGSEKRREV